MQRRKRLRPQDLPLMNPLLKRMLPRNTQHTPIIPPRDIITKVDCFSEKPNGAIHPVPVAEDRFRGPPLAEAVVEGGEC